MQKSQAENSGAILRLLESVDRDGERSQRMRASEFGVAVGLVNSYFKFCVRKGFIKVRRIPAQRYVYFLTPKGFAEKSRLTILHLSTSLTFFRQARRDYSGLLQKAEERRWKRVVLFGASELAEIATLCGLEAGIKIVAVVDATFPNDRFIGLPVARSFAAAGTLDGCIITERLKPQQSFEAAVAALGFSRVLAPSVLGIALSVGYEHELSA